MTEGDSHHSSGANSPPAQKRQRAKQACEPCRLRKRRCDGGNPCNMCTQFDYRCYYERHPRKRSKKLEVAEGQHPAGGDDSMTYIKEEITKSHCLAGEDISKLRSMEANSGLYFTRLLGMRLDPGAEGPKLCTFSWNLGGPTPVLNKAPPITDLLSYDQMLELAGLFFTKVHPLYGFLDKEWIMRQLALRWSNPPVATVPDHLLCGVAAVGSLFGGDVLVDYMPRIVDAAKTALESTSTMTPPNLHDVSSWLLRVLYLRATDHPHACWMATCTTMHLVESIGLQEEDSNLLVYPPHDDHDHDPDVRRRVFWLARMFNSWVSFEYGRTRVSLRGITCKLPAARADDYTTDYIDLYGLSCCLDPDRNNHPSQWDELLKRVEAFEARHDTLQLSRANLALTAYRRLRIANPNISSESLNRIINILLSGLQSARDLASKGLPWWHVANVPFQTICVLLAMDSRESIAQIPIALQTLETIVTRFKTPAMKEGLKTARVLVRLQKKRKDEDSELLGQGLGKSDVQEPQPSNIQPIGIDLTLPNGSPQQLVPTGPSTTSSGDEFNLDYLANSGFDWNHFLNHEMPAFAPGFAADGSM